MSAACVLAAMLAGCASANWSSIYRDFQVDPKDGLTSVLIDAKQRAIISKKLGDKTVVCAEPSPDVFSAIGQALGTSGSYNGVSQEVQLALSLALAESASELRRARTIQLLRDGLFTACLAYANGSIDQNEFERLQSKYADATVTLLAIEQITPQEVTAPVTLSVGAPTTSVSNQKAPTEKSTEPPPATKAPEAPASGASDVPKPPAKKASDPSSKVKKGAKGTDAPAKAGSAVDDGSAKPAGRADSSSPAASDATHTEAYKAGSTASSQSLAPPTPYAVTAVQSMVTTFLNNTLVNKCLDATSQSAKDLREDARQLAANQQEVARRTHELEQTISSVFAPVAAAAAAAAAASAAPPPASDAGRMPRYSSGGSLPPSFTYFPSAASAPSKSVKTDDSPENVALALRNEFCTQIFNVLYASKADARTRPLTSPAAAAASAAGR